LESKRLALAFGLSAALILVWLILFPQAPPPKPAPGRPPTAVAGGAGTTAAPAAAAAAAAAGKTPTPEAVAAPPAGPPVAGTEGKEIVVASRLYTARLSNRGGDLVSFVLTSYKDATGKPLDLVRHVAPFPGRTLGYDRADSFLTEAAGALHQVEHESTGAETTVRFHYRDGAGDGIVRTYTFRQSYVVGLRVEREGPRKAQSVAVVLGPGLGNPSPEELKNNFTKPGSTVWITAAASADRKAKDGLKEVVALGKGLAAAGLEDNYFLTVFLPSATAEISLRPVALGGSEGKAGEPESEVIAAAPGTLESELFLGPKKLDVLEKLRPGLDKTIDYGMFAFIVKPFLWALQAINRNVGNWGVSIIIITILIKLALYPLTHKQLVSAKRMSMLQPKIDQINAKYAPKIKTDPEARLKKNEEVMAVFSAEGINPAAGCLPLLPQLPILWAFYSLLAHSIELRHAPFALWLTDLSVKDPYYITPIVMTITMWWQQQMTPPQGDPAMRRMMAIMPWFMGFMFKDTPAGLVLYWLVQNILTIMQQMLLNRFTDLGPKSMKKVDDKDEKKKR